MEVIPKGSNFIEEKKQHPKSRYTSDIRRLRVGARPAHFIVSEARHIERGNINLYRPPLLTEHILPYALPPRNHSKDEALTMGEAPRLLCGEGLTQESIQTFSIFVLSDQIRCKL